MAIHINRDNQFSICATQAGTYNVLGAGCYEWSMSNSDDTEDMSYYAENSSMPMDELVLDGKNIEMTFSCHKNTNDTAQNMILGMRDDVGTGRHVYLKWVDVTNKTRTFECTMTAFKYTGGSAEQRFGFTFTLHINKVVS